MRDLKTIYAAAHRDEFAEAREESKKTLPCDVSVDFQGTIVLFWPKTDDALRWLTENLESSCPRWLTAFVVEHRYAGAIYEGLVEAGYRVGRKP